MTLPSPTLSRSEAAVLSFVRTHPSPINLGQVEAATLLSPDVAVKAVALLLRSHLLSVHPTADERLLELVAA